MITKRENNMDIGPCTIYPLFCEPKSPLKVESLN